MRKNVPFVLKTIMLSYVLGCFSDGI